MCSFQFRARFRIDYRLVLFDYSDWFSHAKSWRRNVESCFKILLPSSSSSSSCVQHGGWRRSSHRIGHFLRHDIIQNLNRNRIYIHSNFSYKVPFLEMDHPSIFPVVFRVFQKSTQIDWRGETAPRAAPRHFPLQPNRFREVAQILGRSIAQHHLWSESRDTTPHGILKRKSWRPVNADWPRIQESRHGGRCLEQWQRGNRNQI